MSLILQKFSALLLWQKISLLSVVIIVIGGGAFALIIFSKNPRTNVPKDPGQTLEQQSTSNKPAKTATPPSSAKKSQPAPSKNTPAFQKTSPSSSDDTSPVPSSSSGTTPQPAPSTRVWTWPANAGNTGPTGTLTPYTGPSFITVDGTVIRDKDIVMNDGEELVIQANNVQIINSRIRYVGTLDSDNCFVCVLQGYQGLVFDHVEMDANHRFEYGLLAFSPFTIKYSKFHAASHVIDAAGDPANGNPTSITHSYIYDADNKPFSSTNQYGGHSAAVYFSGDNSAVYVGENTIVTPRYALGPTCPPNPCHDNSVTATLAIYADEGVINPSSGSYTYHHNALSSGGYYYTQFRGGTGGIKNLTFTNNVLMADAGWPNGTIAGGTYILENVASATFTGNIWGPGTPNAGQAANN